MPSPGPTELAVGGCRWSSRSSTTSQNFGRKAQNPAPPPKGGQPGPLPQALARGTTHYAPESGGSQAGSPERVGASDCSDSEFGETARDLLDVVLVVVEVDREAQVSVARCTDHPTLLQLSEQ
jgi:hypothetical protein